MNNGKKKKKEKEENLETKMGNLYLWNNFPYSKIVFVPQDYSKGEWPILLTRLYINKRMLFFT